MNGGGGCGEREWGQTKEKIDFIVSSLWFYRKQNSEKSFNKSSGISLLLFFYIICDMIKKKVSQQVKKFTMFGYWICHVKLSGFILLSNTDVMSIEVIKKWEQSCLNTFSTLKPVLHSYVYCLLMTYVNTITCMLLAPVPWCQCIVRHTHTHARAYEEYRGNV